MWGLSKFAATLGAAALLLAGGAAYALASSTRSTITVCVKHHGGTLYKAKRCAKHDTRLSWNKHGSAGATGAPGPQGLKGDTGPQGPGASTIATTLPAGTAFTISQLPPRSARTRRPCSE
jgi:hypothetical protein